MKIIIDILDIVERGVMGATKIARGMVIRVKDEKESSKKYLT